MSKWYELINDAVSMKDAAQMYIGDRIRNGRIPCPFHNGKDDNLALYDNCFKCYVCGAKGGVIRFVQMLYKLSPYQAEQKINADFCLGLPIEDGRQYTVWQQIEAEQKLREMRRKREEKEKRIAECEEKRTKAQDDWIFWDTWIRAAIGDHMRVDIGWMMLQRQIANENWESAEIELYEERR